MVTSPRRGEILSINISDKTGMRKTPVEQVSLNIGTGISGDAHGTNKGDKWHRQVSLLAMESIKKMVEQGLDVGPGDFAENITTNGIDLLALPIGEKIRVGSEVVLRITQHGKECHDRCAIYHQAGDCVMPREGIFAEVLQGGTIRKSDSIITIDETES